MKRWIGIPSIIAVGAESTNIYSSKERDRERGRERFTAERMLMMLEPMTPDSLLQ